MFPNIPAGRENPLDRKQLRWLLILLAVIMVALVAVVVRKQGQSDRLAPISVVENGKNMTPAPTEAEIQAQLDALAKRDAKSLSPLPTEAEIKKQLEMLAREDKKNPAPKPTQEEIQKQLEMLSKQ
jgi:hypothetical protein